MLTRTLSLWRNGVVRRRCLTTTTSDEIRDMLPDHLKGPIRYVEDRDDDIDKDALIDPNFADSTVKLRYRNADGSMYAKGRRKTASARVWIKEIEPKDEFPSFTVNNKPLHEYFKNEDARLWSLQPLGLTETSSKYHVKVLVKGGGLTGQSQAIRHGLATALRFIDPSLRKTLKDAGYLTRDIREVERKKPGRKKARKKKQWVKR